MATIRNEVPIVARAQDVWQALRDFGAVHRRVVPGFVVDCRLDGDARVLTFANGLVARERLVDIDDDNRRLVYAVPEGLAEHYNGSVQVFEDGPTRCRVEWLIDLLPNTLAPQVSKMAEQGATAMRKTLNELGQR
jgi:hypothetical protein